MRTILLFLIFSLATVYGKQPENLSISESIEIKIPDQEAGLWKRDIYKVNEFGRVIEVFRKSFDDQEERIIVVSSPFKATQVPTIAKAISSAILPVKLQKGSRWEVLHQDMHHALLKWSVKKEKTSLCKLIIGTHALHSVTYAYEGKNAHRIDENKWIAFLRRTKLKKGTSLTESQ